MQNWKNKISSLPISSSLEEICETLKKSPSRFLILTAQTGAGKSTALPLALLENFPQKILMLEPRRLAASSIADRLSELLGEETGQTVGYRMHLESKISDKSRLEVITEAILTRMIQNDPSLDGVSVVVLDEFHERSVHGDLALAFLKEAMALREDLFVLVMSATIDSKRLSEYLDGAPVFSVPGRLFPVQELYDEKRTVSQAVIHALDGGYPEIPQKFIKNPVILCFLPGIREIRKAKTELEEKLSPEEAEILVLHSSVPSSEQKKIFSPQKENCPRIILSSAIAETSLTVPGVTMVVDSGFSRISKMNPALGMEGLETVRESKFSAEQRKGRAGRLQEGICLRLWNKFDILQNEVQPEILRADLIPLVLECAQWGVCKKNQLDWLDPPTDAIWNTSVELLKLLDCLDSDGKITEKGSGILSLGLHPRLACVLLAGLEKNSLDLALESVLSFSQYSQATEKRQRAFTEDLKIRLKKLTFAAKNQEKNQKVSKLLLSGFADRIAKKSEIQNDDSAKNGKTEYQFPSGRKAFLYQDFAQSPEWLVTPNVDAGASSGIIHSFEPLSESEAMDWILPRSKTFTESRFAGNLSQSADIKNLKLQKFENLAFGAIILKSKKIPVEPSDFGDAICSAVKEKALTWLNPPESVWNFLIRAEFFARQSENSGLLEKIQNLSQNCDEWLKPFLSSGKIDGQIILDSLRWYLDAGQIDKNVPEKITLANGKTRKIFYEKHVDSEGKTQSIQPVLEIIIQQIFGCFESPKVMGVPLLLKLLSPARRPLQITSDLAGFWTGAWPEICKEMKGRYPKHNWDYKVTEID